MWGSGNEKEETSERHLLENMLGLMANLIESFRV